MYWSAEEFVLVITAFLFMAIVASSFLPRVELTPTSRATFAIGAAACIGSAALLVRIEDVHYPWVVWALPLLPLAVIAVVARDARMRAAAGHAAAAPARHRSTTPASHASTPLVTVDDDDRGPVRRATVFMPPREQAVVREERSQRVLRERAANPHASPQELASIAYSHPEIRATVAGNPAAPANLLEWLAAVGDTAVHAAISARVPAPPQRAAAL